MKILFFSDLHGSAAAFERLEKYIAGLKPDTLAFLGDALYHGPRNPLPEGYDPKKVSAMLNKYRDVITAVHGNCDAEVDQLMLDFPIFSNTAEITDGKMRFLLAHGHHPEHTANAGDRVTVVTGHTHIPVLEKSADGRRIIFNPGSVSLPKNSFPPSFGFYDGDTISVIALDRGENIFTMRITR